MSPVRGRCHEKPVPFVIPKADSACSKPFCKFCSVWHCCKILSILWECSLQFFRLLGKIADYERIVNYYRSKDLFEGRDILLHCVHLDLRCEVSWICWHLAIGLNLAIAKSNINIMMPMIKTIVMIMTQILTVANSWISISSCLLNAIIVVEKVNLTSTFFQWNKSIWASS